jgi:nitrate reductase NapE
VRRAIVRSSAPSARRVDISAREAYQLHRRFFSPGIMPKPDDAVRDRVPSDSASQTRTEELRSFLFLTAVMAPVLAVIVVGGYGFAVWLYQMFAGPPAA